MKKVMQNIWAFIRKNWIVVTIAVVLVAVGIIATVYICKQERQINILQQDYNSLVRDYNSLVVRDSLLYEEYLALQRTDSICSAANDSLARATSVLRDKCDSLQRAKRVVVQPAPARKRTIPTNTSRQPRQYPDLDW